MGFGSFTIGTPPFLGIGSPLVLAGGRRRPPTNKRIWAIMGVDVPVTGRRLVLEADSR
jgi:hypothetical protein